jgi:hypothetical protein
MAPAAKTLSFLLPAFRCRGSSLQKLKDFALPFFGDAVITRCFPWLRSGRLRYAPFHNARSLRHALNSLAINFERKPRFPKSLLMRLRRGETVPALLSRTDSEFAVVR